MNSNSDATVGVILVVLLVIVGLLIFLAVYLIKKSSEAGQRSETMAYQLMQSLPSDKQMLFTMRYNADKKNATTGVLLALFLGGWGAHKFYLGQSTSGIFFILFCWTGIPSIIAIFDAFTMSAKIGEHNLKKAHQIAAMLGGSNPMM